MAAPGRRRCPAEGRSAPRPRTPPARCRAETRCDLNTAPTFQPCPIPLQPVRSADITVEPALVHPGAFSPWTTRSRPLSRMADLREPSAWPHSGFVRSVSGSDEIPSLYPSGRRSRHVKSSKARHEEPGSPERKHQSPVERSITLRQFESSHKHLAVTRQHPARHVVTGDMLPAEPEGRGGRLTPVHPAYRQPGMRRSGVFSGQGLAGRSTIATISGREGREPSTASGMMLFRPLFTSLPPATPGPAGFDGPTTA